MRRFVLGTAVMTGLAWWAGWLQCGERSTETRRAGSCRLENDWNGAPDNGEVVDALVFASGEGEVAYGENRIIYYEIRFDYERRGDRLTLHYEDPWKGPRTIRYQLREGRYPFRWQDIDTGEWHEHTYRCRLTLSDSPAPEDLEPPGPRAYYGDRPAPGR